MQFVYFFSCCCLGALTILVKSVNGQSPVYDNNYIQAPCDNSRNFTLGANGYQKYGFIEADDDGCYNPNSTCNIRLSASSGHRITLRIQWVAIEQSDVLIIKEESQTHLLNGYIAPIDSIYSTSNWMNLEFITNADINKCLGGFRVYYTSFHYGECSENEFRCSIQARCIPNEVVCDSYDNCGDWSDEVTGSCGVRSTTPGTSGPGTNTGTSRGTSTGVVLKAGYHLPSTLLTTFIFIVGLCWSII